MDRIIEMKDVSWRRLGKEIIHHIDWTVQAGEHWAVLGLNGAGKTTLLNMVNGYIWPTTGQVNVLGNTFGKTDINELRKLIGWVSSSLGERVNGRHKAEDIVVSGKYAAVGLVFQEPTEADFQRGRELLQTLGASHLEGKEYEKCSQGEKQKVLIARSLMANPRLLILDEPTNGLDFISKEDLLEAVQTLAQEEDAPTIIYVTHHIEEVLPIFSHSLLLKDGTVFQAGKREDIITSEHMTKMYGRDIHVDWKSDRPWMSLR